MVPQAVFSGRDGGRQALFHQDLGTQTPILSLVFVPEVIATGEAEHFECRLNDDLDVRPAQENHSSRGMGRLGHRVFPDERIDELSHLLQGGVRIEGQHREGAGDLNPRREGNRNELGAFFVDASLFKWGPRAGHTLEDIIFEGGLGREGVDRQSLVLSFEIRAGQEASGSRVTPKGKKQQNPLDPSFQIENPFIWIWRFFYYLPQD